MIKTIAGLRTLDAQISEEFGKAILHLKFLLFESDFKNLSDVCFMFMATSDLLKNSIFNCVENGDYYSANVLYRSLSEHYFRFNYFRFSHSSFKDDAYALLFRTSLDFSEQMAIENALNHALQIKGQKLKSQDEIWEKLATSNKIFAKFSLGEITEFSKSLRMKNIVRFLEKQKGSVDRENDTFLQERIIEYAQLSSFVHGGPLAHKELVHVELDANREKIYLNLCGPTLQMATSIKILSFLAIYQFKPEFGVYYNNTQVLMRKINEGR